MRCGKRGGRGGSQQQKNEGHEKLDLQFCSQSCISFLALTPLVKLIAMFEL
jgi:hypothetical protein